jgi:uncharacterized lipoprotein YehR (DUF1307 family)
MKSSLLTIIRLAVLAPAFFLTACGGDEEGPSTPALTCVQLTDSSAIGTVSLQYDTQNRLVRYNFDTLNTTFTYQGDSIFYSLNSDTLQYKEVLYKSGSQWSKSVQRVFLNSQAFGEVQSVITFIPTYNNGNITQIARSVESKVILNGVPLSGPTQISTVVFNRNADGNITRIEIRENGNIKNFDYTYSNETIGTNNVGLYATSLSEVLQGGIIPLFLGYLKPFNKMPLTFTTPDGNKTYSNWKKDANGNLTNYRVVGTGDYEEETGNVKSTFSCK